MPNPNANMCPHGRRTSEHSDGRISTTGGVFRWDGRGMVLDGVASTRRARPGSRERLDVERRGVRPPLCRPAGDTVIERGRALLPQTRGRGSRGRQTQPHRSSVRRSATCSSLRAEGSRVCVLKSPSQVVDRPWCGEQAPLVVSSSLGFIRAKSARHCSSRGLHQRSTPLTLSRPPATSTC